MGFEWRIIFLDIFPFRGFFFDLDSNLDLLDMNLNFFGKTRFYYEFMAKFAFWDFVIRTNLGYFRFQINWGFLFLIDFGPVFLCFWNKLQTLVFFNGCTSIFRFSRLFYGISWKEKIYLSFFSSHWFSDSSHIFILSSFFPFSRI